MTRKLVVFFLMFSAAACVHAQSKQNDGAALFMQIHSVLTHPRCLNCHPRGDSPKQGMQRQVHMPPITRGAHDSGPPGLQCSACHQKQNFAGSGVPGAPGWHLAPRPQAWEGKTPGEICRSLKDRKTNGGKSVGEIAKHMTDDALVAWAWTPGQDPSGRDREPPPIAKPEFNRIVQAWAQAGAACPQ